MLEVGGVVRVTRSLRTDLASAIAARIIPDGASTPGDRSRLMIGECVTADDGIVLGESSQTGARSYDDSSLLGEP